MGNVGSRIEDAPTLHLKDQNRCMFKFQLQGSLGPQLTHAVSFHNFSRRHQLTATNTTHYHSKWISC